MNRNAQHTQQDGWVVRVIRRVLRWLADGFFHIELRNLDRVPAEGGAIVAANHPSLLDGILLLAFSPRPVRFLIAEDLYTHRFLNPIFRAFGCIQVYRTKTHNGDALRAAVEAIARGEVLGIFPEGTIRFRGEAPEIKQGVALLALRTGAPVIPLAFAGTFEAYPDGARVPTPGPIQLRFGESVAFEPTDAERIPDARVAAVREDIHRRMLSTLLCAKRNLDRDAAPTWWKTLRITAAGLIILPLTHFLTLTANPSLDPHTAGGNR